jgi:arginase
MNKPSPAGQPAPRRFSLIGAPTAAGAHSPGIEKAPAALRAAGLVERLRAAGLTVTDRGDLPVEPFRLDRDHPRAQNAGRVAAFAREVAQRTRDALQAGELPLVVGGDCTIVLGALAALVERALAGGPDVGLVYLDAHPDLNTPEAVFQGALDWMGMAHVLAVPGAVTELVELGPRVPLLAWDKVAFLSFVESEVTETERILLDEREPLQYGATRVVGRPRETAQIVARALTERVPRFLVHLDVDALDFAQFPIADNAYQRNQGLSLDEAMEALTVLAGHTAFAGLVLTQVNPDHTAGQGPLLEELCDGLAAALAAAPEPVATARPR